MSEVMASQLADLAGAAPELTYAPNQVPRDFFFRLGSGRLMAVSLYGPADEERFFRATGHRLGRPVRRGELLTLELDQIAGWPDADVERHLVEAGLAVSVVRAAPELAQDPFLRGTGLFQTVEGGDLGHYDVTGLPWRFVGRKREALRPAPERPTPTAAASP